MASEELFNGEAPGRSTTLHEYLYNEKHMANTNWSERLNF